MHLIHITKQLSGHKGLKRKPAPFSFSVAAGHRRGLRSDGARSLEEALPTLQKLLWKQGADELNASLTLSLLPQGGLAVSHWLLMDLRVSNMRLELLSEEAGWPRKVTARKRTVAVTQERQYWL